MFPPIFALQCTGGGGADRVPTCISAATTVQGTVTDAAGTVLSSVTIPFQSQETN